MKKIRSFSLFLALFLLFSFTSCVNESGEITTEYTKTVNTEVITQENQWVGFSESNQVIEKYYQIASTVVNNYYDDAIRPCSSAYCWVDLNKNGCWLMSEYSDSPYVGRWRYSA